MKTLHGVVILDYEGPSPQIPNVHAFGFMEVEPRDFGLDYFDRPIQPFSIAEAEAHKHWQRHLTFTVRGDASYEQQHVFTYEPGVLIHHLFSWGTDMAKFDPTLPRFA